MGSLGARPLKNRKFVKGLFPRLVDGVPCKIISMAFQSGQNCQQCSWSKLVPISWSNTYCYGQNSHFCCQTDFLMFRPTNFLDHKISWSQNFLVNLHSIPMPKFHAQPYSIPLLCSTPFHSNSISWSVTVSTYLYLKSATPCCLPSVSFERSLGKVTILHRRCRI